jgi:hypothetical protein
VQAANVLGDVDQVASQCVWGEVLLLQVKVDDLFKFKAVHAHHLGL